MLSAPWCLISPAAHLRIEMKSALEAYLVQAALLIYSGVLLVSTHVYFAVPSITGKQVHMCFTYTF